MTDSSDLIRLSLAKSKIRQTQKYTPSDVAVIKEELNEYSVGSAYYSDTSLSYKAIPFDEDFRLGTGDFTIEWWQSMQTVANYPRVFSLGHFGDGPGSLTVSIALSFEINGTNRDIYYWRNSGGVYGGNNGYRFVTVPNSYLQNVWHHFALVRSSGVTSLYIDGVSQGTPLSDSTNIGYAEPVVSSGTPTGYDMLVIGDELPENTTATTSYAGFIYSFRWTKGNAVYKSNFTVPSNFLQPVTGTKLLLLNWYPGGLNIDSSGYNKTIYSYNANVYGISPFSLKSQETFWATSPTCINLNQQTI
jgi:Concanavalin A-like lectin/glucanases superfamily